MFDKILELFERMVIALEVIAQKQSSPVVYAAQEGSLAAPEENAKDPNEAPTGYDAWSRDAIIAECTARGIETTGETGKGRTTRLMIKELEESDAKAVSAPPADPAAPDPFGQTEPDEAPDPFGAPAPTVDDTKVWDLKNDIMPMLQKFMQENGKEATFKVIDQATGVKLLKEVPAEKFGALVNAVQNFIA